MKESWQDKSMTLTLAIECIHIVLSLRNVCLLRNCNDGLG